MPFKITAIYAGLNGIILLVLAIRVARQRGISKVGLGTGGDAALERAIRIHGNAVENIPIVLILLGLAEAFGSKPLLLHGIGIALTLGRLFHAILGCVLRSRRRDEPYVARARSGRGARGSVRRQLLMSERAQPVLILPSI